MPPHKDSPFADSASTVHPLTIEFTVYYTVQPPENEAGKPPALLLALHGYGQKCRGFMRQFTALRKRNMLLVAPQGPHQIYMQMEPKKVGCNWLTVYEKENSIRDFVGYMNRLVTKVGERHVFDPRQVYVLGFSQGVSMAYRLSVSKTLPIAGLVACCSDLPPDVAERLPSIAPFPVLLAHSPDDPVAPPEKGGDAERQLRQHGFPVTRLVYEGGHAITEEVVEKTGAWIQEQVGLREEGLTKD
ncbi:MAG: hypothetical protein WC655_20185 [Candidatus Hydrogenedentales bacterium]|jgi:phospholipase/carboxylesterase